MIPAACKACKYGIKDVCLKEQISFEICNICCTVYIHKILDMMVEKFKGI